MFNMGGSEMCSHSSEDIGALVFDMGHHSFRAGYAQDNNPRVDLPAAVGVVVDGNLNAVKTESLETDSKPNPSNISSNSSKYYVDTNSLYAATKGKEVYGYLKEGMIEDWDLFEKVLDYTYTKCFRTDSTFHPVLMSEPPVNESRRREMLTELMFEKFNVPAFFLSINAVLVSFTSNRATGLVLDSGATHTTAVPIVEGTVVKNAIVRSPIGGDYITMLCKQFLQENRIDIVPTYMIGSKEVVKEGERARYTIRYNLPPVTESWHAYMERRVVQNFQSSVLQVLPTPYKNNVMHSGAPHVHYEFPHGYHQDFKNERFSIPEVLFDPNVQTKDGSLENTVLGAGNVVNTSIKKCDAALRPALYNNITITGGNTLLKGYVERLSGDLLMKIKPCIKLKLICCLSSSERRFGAWIGGSVLASIGSFHQMLISRQEYDEFGNSQVIKKLGT